MQNINQLIADHKEAKQQLRMIEQELSNAVLALPNEVLQAVENGIVRFNFPVEPWVKSELKKRSIDKLNR